MTTEPTLITPTHAARHLQIHRRTLNRLVKSGRLHRDPASRCFKQEDIILLGEERYQQRREALIVRIMANVERQLAQARLEAETFNTSHDRRDHMLSDQVNSSTLAAALNNEDSL